MASASRRGGRLHRRRDRAHGDRGQAHAHPERRGPVPHPASDAAQRARPRSRHGPDALDLPRRDGRADRDVHDVMSSTIVLVHGAYADSSSWNGVIESLATDGHRVNAWANPLRGVATDAAALSDLLRTLDGPVLLAGHSYGGAVMTNVDPDAGDLSSLVYV